MVSATVTTPLHTVLSYQIFKNTAGETPEFGDRRQQLFLSEHEDEYYATTLSRRVHADYQLRTKKTLKACVSCYPLVEIFLIYAQISN